MTIDSLLDSPTGCCRRVFRISAVLLLLMCAGCASLVRPNYTTELNELRGGEYSLDPEHAFVLFRVGHLDLSTVVGRFNTVDASLDFDPAALESLRMDGQIAVASIDIGNEDLERRLGGREWLDAESHPVASFRTTGVDSVEGNRFKLRGELTLRGETRPIELDARFNGGADNILTGRYTLGFSADATILRSAYGMDALGALVSDEIEIEIHAEFQRRP